MKTLRTIALPLLIAIAATTSSACMSAQKPSAAENVHAGWYMEHAGQATLQLCGQSVALHTSMPSELSTRAKTFDLGEDTPIYVRVVGRISGDAIKIARVEQFGSPTPVRDCAMNGVVIPSPQR